MARGPMLKSVVTAKHAAGKFQHLENMNIFLKQLKAKDTVDALLDGAAATELAAETEEGDEAAARLMRGNKKEDEEEESEAPGYHNRV